MKKACKIVLGAVSSVAAYLAVTAAGYLPFVIGDARKEHCDKCDFLLILGGNVIGADTPGEQLRERMNAAVRFLRENSDCTAVPCGGCFRRGQKKTEARIIGDYLIENGIDADRILLEDKSTTTFENFEFAFKLIEKHTYESINELSVGFLTSDYHVFRAAATARYFGLREPKKVSCKTASNPLRNYAREYFVAYELLIKKTKNKKT